MFWSITVAKRAQNTSSWETPTNRHNFENKEIELYSKHFEYDQVQTRNVSGTAIQLWVFLRGTKKWRTAGGTVVPEPFVIPVAF